MNLERLLEAGRLDDLARLDSPIHRLDPLSKLLTTLFFLILVVSFPRYEISALMPFFIFPLWLAVRGHIPPDFIMKRVAMVAPFALLLLAANPLLDTWRMEIGGGFSVPAGYLSFLSGMVRFILCVSISLILLAVTGMPALCTALGQMGLPKIFVTQLMFLYRYIFLISDDVLRMLRSISLRLGARKRLKFREYCNLVGHLLLRSLDRASRVYKAMLARGFNGEIQLGTPAHLKSADLLFVCGWCLFLLLARTNNLAAMLGRLVMGAAWSWS